MAGVTGRDYDLELRIEVDEAGLGSQYHISIEGLVIRGREAAVPRLGPLAKDARNTPLARDRAGRL